VGEAAGRVPGLLDETQVALKAEAAQLLADRTTKVSSLEDAVEAAATGFAELPGELIHDGGEAKLAAQGVTVRVVRRADGGLPQSDDEPDTIATVARAY
jgi:prolyl-tRNA synthetase